MLLVRILAISILFQIGACSSHDSGPAAAALKKQLVGHWSTPGNDNLYYGETDPGSEIGSFVMVHPDGKVFTHRYKIESVDSSKRTIKATLLFASGDTREETLVVANDGSTVDTNTTITGLEIQSQMTRVDDTIAP